MNIRQLIHLPEIVIKKEDPHAMDELDKGFWRRGEHTSVFCESFVAPVGGGGAAAAKVPERAAEDRGPGNAVPAVPAEGRAGACLPTPPS